MLIDVCLSVALALTAIAFVAIGVHASISPVSIDDAKLPILRRHRTQIWTILGALVVINIILVVYQARRQGAATVTLDDFKTGISDIKAMIQRNKDVGNLSQLSVSKPDVVSAKDQKSRTTVSPSNTQPLTPQQQVASRAKEDALNQLSVIAQAQKPVIQPLTHDQIALIAFSCGELATTIRQASQTGIKQYWDDFKARENNEREEYLRQGKSQQEAEQLVISEHTGSAGMYRAQELRSIAAAVVVKHMDQIQSIINILKSDPSKYQGTLKSRLTTVENQCPFPGDDAENCAGPLEALAAVVK